MLSQKSSGSCPIYPTVPVLSSAFISFSSFPAKLSRLSTNHFLFFLCRFHQRADTLPGNLCLMHRIKQFCSARGLYRQLYKTCQKCCKRCNIPGSAIPVSKTSVVNFRIPSTQSSTSRIALVMISPSPSSTPAFSHEFSGSHLLTNYIY